jgi:hypothetical protein
MTDGQSAGSNGGSNSSGSGGGSSGSGSGSGSHAWGGGSNIPNGHGTATDPNPLTPPVVPKGSGGSGNKQSVHTPSMELFANNIDVLIQPVLAAAKLLAQVAVAPGAFYHANQMRTKVSGANNDAGLKAAYTKVLDDLATGLTDIRNGMRELSKKYKSAEDAGRMSAKAVQDAMNKAQADFNTLMTDNGGSGAGTGTGTGTGNGSGSGSGSGGNNGSGNGSGS